jgi:predicted dienelactone hydrolase
MPLVPPPVALQTFRFVDAARHRTLVTDVRRVPAGQALQPLVVFAHGFALMPDAYAALLDAWARAGFVVAAPVFPGENAHARGGPDEADLVNEPTDIHVVISDLLRTSLPIDPTRIAVAGQSDGGVAALGAAYAQRLRDRRIDAAVIMSGAWPSGWHFVRGPPLLAIQGTADPINPPVNTTAYFALASPPKRILWLRGASHLPPYTTDARERTIVARATIAFLDRYLKGTSTTPGKRR